MDEMNVYVEVTPKFMEKMATKVLSTDLKAFVQEEEELVHLKREIQKNVKDIIGVNTDSHAPSAEHDPAERRQGQAGDRQQAEVREAGSHEHRVQQQGAKEQ